MAEGENNQYGLERIRLKEEEDFKLLLRFFDDYFPLFIVRPARVLCLWVNRVFFSSLLVSIGSLWLMQTAESRASKGNSSVIAFFPSLPF